MKLFKLTFLEASYPNGHGCLGIADLVGLIQNDAVPVDLEEGGAAGHAASATRSLLSLRAGLGGEGVKFVRERSRHG